MKVVAILLALTAPNAAAFGKSKPPTCEQRCVNSCYHCGLSFCPRTQECVDTCTRKSCGSRNLRGVANDSSSADDDQEVYTGAAVEEGTSMTDDNKEESTDEVIVNERALYTYEDCFYVCAYLADDDDLFYKCINGCT
eukprot:scaffold5916_cov44-Cyclotella_meneghiniana.AAC.10